MIIRLNDTRFFYDNILDIKEILMKRINENIVNKEGAS